MSIKEDIAERLCGICRDWQPGLKKWADIPEGAKDIWRNLAKWEILTRIASSLPDMSEEDEWIRTKYTESFLHQNVSIDIANDELEALKELLEAYKDKIKKWLEANNGGNTKG